MFYMVSPNAAKTVKFNHNLDLGGITCQQEVFIGPDETHKLTTGGVSNVVMNGVSKDFSVPINMPAVPGVNKIFVTVTYQGQLLLIYAGINGVLVLTGTISDPTVV